jgi:hypothetical protein
MKAKVRGFRGAEKADIDIDRIALIGGLNGAGKSSICQAIAAAACSQPIPFFRSTRPDKPVLTKTDAKALLRGGMEKGSSIIEVDGQVVAEALWPGLTAAGNGKIQCSLVAAGLVNPMEMEEADRQRFFSTLLNADPTMDDLREALKEAIPALADPDYVDALEKVITMAQTNGWDVAHKHFKEHGARRKGEWEGKAGESFGSKKAADWKPQGWRADLEEKSLEELGTACTEAQEAVERALAAVATDAANLAQLVEQANGEAGAWNALQEADTAYKAARADLAAKESQRQAIVIPTATPCPHCGGLVDIEEGKRGFTLKQSMANGAEIEAAKKGYEAAGLLVRNAMLAAETRQAAYNTAKGAHDARKGATERLKEAKKRTGTTETVDLARDFLAGVMRDKDLIERRQACETLAAQIGANQKLVDILSPEGLRRQKLQKALKVSNGQLAALSSDAGYGTVTIDDDLEILYGGRRYFLLSQSEQYRVRAVIQIYVAMHDKSPLVIFDSADVLDQDGRNGLFALMQEVDGISFLVGMTVLSRKNVPDLAKAGIGASYWVADGTAAPL